MALCKDNMHNQISLYVSNQAFYEIKFQKGVLLLRVYVGSLFIRYMAIWKVFHQNFKGIFACARSVSLVSIMCLCFISIFLF